MTGRLVLAPEAELDIAEAYAWYESRRLGLGEEFLSSVDASMESIRRRPEIYSLVHGSYRRSLIRRFPYAVFYEYAETTVTSTACFTRHATHRSGASASPDQRLCLRLKRSIDTDGLSVLRPRRRCWEQSGVSRQRRSFGSPSTGWRDPGVIREESNVPVR